MADPDHERTIIHFDIDCFYAQVEMIRNPSLREKPLGIQQKYLLVTCNYEARKRGVTKLMSIADAQRKCPDLVIVKGEDLTHYRNMSYQISDFIQKYTPLVERLGFDENFADVTDIVQHRIKQGNFKPKFSGRSYEFIEESSREIVETASCDHESACGCGCFLRIKIGSQIAADIREGLKLELGITCCAGIAHNKLLAKLVGSLHKPNQQTSILPHLGCQLVSSLSGIRSIPGIGSRSTKRLISRGIESIWDLQQAPLTLLEDEFGKPMAEMFSKLSFGVDASPVVPFSLPQTISDEDSFRCCNELEDAKSRIHELVVSLLKRLKEDSRIPSTLRLTVRGKDYVRNCRQCPLPINVFKDFDKDFDLEITASRLMPILTKLFNKLVDLSKSFHLTLINVCFAKFLTPNSKQNTLDSFFTCQSLKTDSSRATQSYNHIVKKIPTAGTEDFTNNVSKVNELCKEAIFSGNKKGLSNTNAELEIEMIDGTNEIVITSTVIEENENEDIEGNKLMSIIDSHIDSNSKNVSNSASDKKDIVETTTCKKVLHGSDLVLDSDPISDKDATLGSHSEMSLSSLQNLKKLLPKHIDACDLLQLPEDIQNEVLESFGISVKTSKDGRKLFARINHKISTRSQRKSENSMDQGKCLNEPAGSSNHRKPLFSPSKRKAENEKEEFVISKLNVIEFPYVKIENSSQKIDAKRQKLDDDIRDENEKSVGHKFKEKAKCEHFSMIIDNKNIDLPHSLTFLPINHSDTTKLQINSIALTSDNITGCNEEELCDSEFKFHEDNIIDFTSQEDLTLTCKNQSKSNDSWTFSDNEEDRMAMQSGLGETQKTFVSKVDNGIGLNSITRSEESQTMQESKSLVVSSDPQTNIHTKLLSSSHSGFRQEIITHKSPSGELKVSSQKPSVIPASMPTNQRQSHSSNSAGGKCPDGFDPDVFNSLPSNIQGEILAHTAMGTADIFINNDRQIQSNNNSRPNCVSPACSNSITSKPNTSKKRRHSQKDIFDYFKKK